LSKKKILIEKATFRSPSWTKSRGEEGGFWSWGGVECAKGKKKVRWVGRRGKGKRGKRYT